MTTADSQPPAARGAESGHSSQTGDARLLLLQTRVLERIARGAKLGETLDTLAELVESEYAGSRCGICVLDPARKRVDRSFAPNLPANYRDALVGVVIPEGPPYPGPCSQSMVEGTAFTCKDLRTAEAWRDTAWAQYLIGAGFLFCRSTPVLDLEGRSIGSITLYLPGTGAEPESFPYLSQIAANLASIAIERESAELALQESNEQLRTALEGANLGNWDYHVPTGEIRWSERCLELFGLPQGSPYSQFLENLHDDDRERVNRSVETALQDSGHYSEEYRVKQPDGSYRWVAAMGRGVYDDDGRIKTMRGISFDITERKLAEARLRESETLSRTQAEHLERTERNLRIALDATGLGLWTLEVATGQISMTERCREKHGFKDTIASAEEWNALIHPDDRAAFHERLRACLAESGDGNLNGEYRLIEPNGRIQWVSVFGKVLYDDGQDGSKPARIIGATLDLTDRKLMERAVEDNAERFRFLAESLPAKIFTADESGEITYFNGQWATYTGQPLTVLHALGWREFVHPHDVEEKQRVWITSINEGTPFEFEHRFRRADGQYRWHLSRAQPMRNTAGNIVTWIGTNMDVHDLKQAQIELEASESRVRLAVEAAGMGYWDWDIGHIVHWSTEHNRIMGLDPLVTEGTYQYFLERVHPDDRSHVMERLEHAELTGEDYSAEFRVIWPDGSLRWVAGHGRPFFEARHPRAVRMLGVVRDITERKNFEDLLSRQQEELKAALAAAEHARDEAEAANRAKDQFLAVLSHELRTPLTPVLMAASTMLYDPALTSDMRETLEMIRRNVQIEARLINDLLDLTRITRNKMELHMASLDLHQVLRQALEICRTELETKPLQLTLDLAAGLHQVEGDSERLQQVFWNLLKNAVKFTPANGRVVVRTENEDDHLLVKVMDTGIGISPEVLSRIFNPFEQGSEEFSRQFGGLGLGLAISKATIDAHDGIIMAESPGNGQGSTFIVKLKYLRT